MTRITPLGSGWLLLLASDERLNNLDVLQLSRAAGQTTFIHEIHVPVETRERIGELVAIPLGNGGERISLGEGCIVPCNRGIQIISPDERKKNKLRVQLVQRLIRQGKFVVLEFLVDKN
jgi:hypothetical protein